MAKKLNERDKQIDFSLSLHHGRLTTAENKIYRLEREVEKIHKTEVLAPQYYAAFLCTMVGVLASVASVIAYTGIYNGNFEGAALWGVILGFTTVTLVAIGAVILVIALLFEKHKLGKLCG